MGRCFLYCNRCFQDALPLKRLPFSPLLSLAPQGVISLFDTLSSLAISSFQLPRKKENIVMRMTSLLVSTYIAVAGSNASANSTILFYKSDPGDYIGRGETVTLTQDDVDFSVSRNFDNGVRFYLNNFNHALPTEYIWWNLDFAAPDSVPLEVGTYENASRFPVQDYSVPGLSHSGSGRGCSTLTGRFEVQEITYVEDNEAVLSFAADYEQHCEGAKPALRGAIRFNSSIPLPIDVGGKITGVAVKNVVCVNQTTGQRVKFSLNAGENKFDCTAAGLDISKGDKVRISVSGSVE